MLGDHRDEERKLLRADLKQAKADFSLCSESHLALVFENITLTKELADREKTIIRLEEEKLAYVSQCPECVTKQKEIDRTREPAAKWLAQEDQQRAEKEAKEAQAREDERKRLRFKELRPRVSSIEAKYNRQKRYSEWDDAAKARVSEYDRRSFAQMEVNDDATLAEYSALKRELKDGGTWGTPEMMALINQEKLEQIEIDRAREGLSGPRVVNEYPAEKRRWDQPKVRH
jgi:hypothetical protein